jgi:cell volume regulation protein A
LLPAGLPRNERAFVVFAGLKGAVPILLGEFLLAAHIPDAERLYGIVVVVVLLSVAVQGGLVPTMARWLQIPMRPREPAPWSLGVRLRDEPERVHRLTVASGAAADGHTIADLADLFGDMWISLVVRDLNLVPVTSNTRLQAGDEVLVLAEPEVQQALADLFERPVTPDS